MGKGKYEYWLTKEGITLLGGWARNGLTDQEIADKINISRSTLSEWKVKFPDIADALKKNKEIFDFEVEAALNELAIGRAKTSRQILDYTRDPMTGEMVITKETRIIEQVPPNVGALIFWLKNRKPDVWRDNPDANKDNGPGGTTINLVCDFERPKREIIDAEKQIEDARAEIEKVEAEQ